MAVADPSLRLSVPASWLYFDGTPSVSNSNGAAYGHTTAEAVEAAKYEIIERHSFMSAWIGKCRGELLDRSCLPVETNWEANRISHSSRLQFQWVSISTGAGEVTVVCIAHSSIAPYVSFGAAHRPSFVEAANKALLEAVTCNLLWTSRIQQIGMHNFVARGFELGQSTKCSPLQIALIEMAWIWAVRKDALEDCLNILTRSTTPHAVPLDPSTFFYSDITPQAIDMGSVVKVIHPDALPLTSCFGHLTALSDILGASTPEPMPLT
jgi:hypothetical protein